MPASLLALLDDITSVMDDVSLLTKVAAKKTAGVLGDDLALNAQQVTGVDAHRELPVVWAVARGSLVNKAILVPVALALSAFAPWAVMPLLMAGGAFLCFEGMEKVAHRVSHRHDADATPVVEAAASAAADWAELERDKVRGAIRTDFILSAEIVAITLGTTADAPLVTQFAVLAGVAVAMTVFVYGLVAGIVKIDDLGLALARRPDALAQRLGGWLLHAAPWLMKALSVAGTVAMFLVGGGIMVHGWPALHHAVESAVAPLPGWTGTLAEGLANVGVGALLGTAVLTVWQGLQRLRGPAR